MAKDFSPVQCIIIRTTDLKTVEQVLTACPLHPSGSAWVMFRDTRMSSGALSMWPERCCILMAELNWYLADKVYWTVGKTPKGVLEGFKQDRRYLGSCGGMLRFTRDEPVKTWTADTEKDSCWERSLTEDASWYVRQISFTCPPDGIVLDPTCKDGFVAEAALLLGRQFIGVADVIKPAQDRINDIVQSLN